MEDFSFDIGGILSEEEADKLFEKVQEEKETPETEPDNEPATEEQEEENADASERVGAEEKQNEEKAVPEGDGSSPNVYSSIASALKKDGIFPDFEDSELESVKTPEDFAELFEKAINARLDERQQRISSALNNGVQPDAVKQYEQTLSYLGSITDEAISAEGEDGENLRRQLIYNDLINRGYDEEKAKRKLEQSFTSGSDIDDAKDALETLTSYYKNGYDTLQKQAKEQAEALRKSQKEQAENFKKMVVDDEIALGELKLDKRTREKVYEAVTKPVYKDPQTGQLLTAVQKFQKENPLEFAKQMGMWFVLTNGGKDVTGFTKEQVRAEKNKGIRELERKINSTSLNPDGTLKYASNSVEGQNMLLSDDWKIG